MKKITSTIFAIIFLAAPVLCFGQQESKTDGNTPPEKCISYTFINEYGFYGGSSIGFTGIFVNGIKFNKTQDVIGLGIGYEIDSRPSQGNYWVSDYWNRSVEGAQTIPIFVNYRHYFPSNKKLKPLINIGIGMRINFWREYYYYNGPWNYNDPWDFYPYPIDAGQLVGVGLYGTMAAGFKVKAFSFTSGFFLKSWNDNYFGGVEVKVGFTF
jgi:hypothetical protein